MPQHAQKLTELLDERKQWHKEVGVFFKEVRLASASSQSDFADDLGISQPYLSQIENGVRTPSWGTIDNLHSIVRGAPDGDTDQDKK